MLLVPKCDYQRKQQDLPGCELVLYPRLFLLYGDKKSRFILKEQKIMI